MMPPRCEREDLDAESIVAAFNDHGVQFVVIGGFASRRHGAPVA
jgi:hypothetical protein